MMVKRARRVFDFGQPQASPNFQSPKIDPKSIDFSQLGWRTIPLQNDLRQKKSPPRHNLCLRKLSSSNRKRFFLAVADFSPKILL